MHSLEFSGGNEAFSTENCEFGHEAVPLIDMWRVLLCSSEAGHAGDTCERGPYGQQADWRTYGEHAN